jgi:outer membrane protein assembly factor BamB
MAGREPLGRARRQRPARRLSHRIFSGHVACATAAAAVLTVTAAGPAAAQLDPLLFLKRTTPTVLLVVETTDRMQRDADNAYYDPFVYPRTGAPWEAALGIDATNAARSYRRTYVNLVLRAPAGLGDRFEADRLAAVGDRDPGFAVFDARTRLGVARRALARAVEMNRQVVSFGLIKTRQASPAIGTVGNDGPVRVLEVTQQAATDTDVPGRWHITRPVVDGPDGAQTAVTPPLVSAGGTSANGAVLALLQRSSEDGGLIAAGLDGPQSPDAPLAFMLDDARAEAARLVAASASNTVVVLVVGGGEGSTSGGDPAASAARFLTLTGARCGATGTRRVPIYVVALAPPSASVASLRSIAAITGGQYLEITKAAIDAVSPGTPVPQLVRAVNTAVQHAFASVEDFNAPPTASLPFGPPTEFQVASPVVGTVNLARARDIDGTSLANSVITSRGNILPQRSNVMVTTGFALPGDVTTPGFPGRLRGFRVYAPVVDSARPVGYRFVGEHTPLWIARPPTAAEGPRNIYTVLPATGAVIPFTATNADALQPYLRDASPADLIAYVRSLPLTGFLDSTPAILDPPSLDPVPDAEYAAFRDANRDRRTLVFVGGNDGMLHAIDGRTGVEVWAFIPANLLPKLRALREGLAVGQFQAFVDASPRLADVRLQDGWHTYLAIGQGPGGTYLQAFDVTLPGLSVAIAPDSDDVSSVLGRFGPSSPIRFAWSYPSYAPGAFDYARATVVTPYGDIAATATPLEKTVGQTWSTPAVGQVVSASGRYVIVAGSGFLPPAQQRQPNRDNVRAGTTVYVFDVATGAVLDSRDVGSDGLGESVEDCAMAPGGCAQMKNALQAGAVLAGPSNSPFINLVYIGDLDGRVWRFGLGMDEATVAFTSGPMKLFDAGASQPLVSAVAVVNVGGGQQYLFFGSGSDLLPPASGAGGFNLFGVLDRSGAGGVAFAHALGNASGTRERVSGMPAVAGDIVFFATTTDYPEACRAPDAGVYAFTFVGGAAYDTTGDAVVDRSDTPKVRVMSGGGRATAPSAADRHLAIGAGAKVEVFGDPAEFNTGVGPRGVRIVTWREIR